jgi:hypothetical protein
MAKLLKIRDKPETTAAFLGESRRLLKIAMEGVTGEFRQKLSYIENELSNAINDVKHGKTTTNNT